MSGAGRKAELNLIFPEAADNFAAYGVKGHRHLPEIVQGLNRASRKPVKLAFTPHLTPMIRGIFATLYAPLKDTGTDLQALYEKRYAGEPFVDVMPAGIHAGHPLHSCVATSAASPCIVRRAPTSR